MNYAPYPESTAKLGPRHCEVVPNPDIFFAEIDLPKNSEARRLTENAKDVCFACPYMLKCDIYALEHPEERGVWGGRSEAERRAVRRSMEV